jgi:ubiquinone/menaquinone biosynthesis C-methylase UbiE
VESKRKNGLVLDRVVLLGRTFEEYERYFALEGEQWRGKSMLDVAAGVSSFSAQAWERGLKVTAVDPIYALPSEEIRERCQPDLDHIVQAIATLDVYRWDFYKDPQSMRQYRERAYKRFLADYRSQGSARYVAGQLPNLPFGNRQFDLALVSYLLFVYQAQFDYEFHKRSILEIARVSSGEVRIYPIVTFEGVRSQYVEQLMNDSELRHLKFEIRQTDFEFLVNSNHVLIIRI